MYIGLDLGTTVCKGALYDNNMNQCGEYYHEYSLITDGDYVEQNADDWWNMVKKTLKTLNELIPNDTVTAIGISTQGISFVPVDEYGTPLHNAFSWLDKRPKEETALLGLRFGENEIYRKTGKPLSAAYTLPKLMWFKKHYSELYEKTHKLLMPLDFLNFKLTGNAVTDYTIASGTMLYNLRDKCWDSELLEFSGITEDKLPQVICMGTEIGRILPDVAKELGIDSGCKIILGGQDQKLAAIGAGIVSSEDVCSVSIGTATAVTKLKPSNFIPSDKSKIPLFVFDDNHIAAEESIMTTGAAIKWLAGIINESYANMDILAEQASPGANGVQFDLSLSTAASIYGLTLATRKEDIIRALYESICYEIKSCIDRLGGAVEIRVFGGGSKSGPLCRMLAEITGLNVCVTDTSEAAALGAAMIASR